MGQDSSPAAGVHAGLLERVLEDLCTVENPPCYWGKAGLETHRRRGRPPHKDWAARPTYRPSSTTSIANTDA